MTPEELRTAIRETGITQAEFARRIGVRPMTVSDWVNGRYPVPKMALMALQTIRHTTPRRKPIRP